MDTFRVRLNCVDHYQAAATDLDPPLFGNYGSTQRNTSPTLPVIRVFGATETGQKVCAHIHGALPYLYIEYQGSLEKAAVNEYTRQLRASIDHALAVSYRRNLYDGSHATFVAHITLVKGVPFFGYHVGYRHFLKIYLLNPLNMTRFADLLHQGAIMKQVFQPFESHMQYLAQWMCDFNLYGCANIECDTITFRDPVPDYLELDSTKHRWHDRTVRPELILDPNLYPRQSHCSIEVDICVWDILNRKEIELRDIHADFVERFKPPAPDEKLVHSLAGLWRDETRRRKMRMGLSDPSSSPFPPEVLISMSADPRNTNKGDWIHEEEFRDMVAELVKGESSDRSEKLSFETFNKPEPLDDSIQTALESVEDLFPQRLAKQLDDNASYMPLQPGNDTQTLTEAVVDESNISQYNEMDFPYESDEDTARDIAMTQRLGPKTETGNKRSGEDSVIAAGSKHPSSGLSASSPFEPPQDADAMRNELHAEEQGASYEPADEEMQNLDGKMEQAEAAIDFAGNGNIDEQFEHRSRKRRKLNQDESHVSVVLQAEDEESGQIEERPRSRHARFVEDLQDRGNKRKSSQNSRSPSSQRRDSSRTPTNSQLSQTSINAGASDNRKVQGFKITKDPWNKRPSQNPKDAQAAQGTPRPSSHLKTPTPSQNRDRTTPKTPWSTDTALLTAKSPLTPTQKPSTQILRLAKELPGAFPGHDSGHTYCSASLPPRSSEVVNTIAGRGLPKEIYQDAFYSNEMDVPERSRDYAGREFKLESLTVPFLPEFDPTGTSSAAFAEKTNVVIDHTKQDTAFKTQQHANNLRNWEILKLPPSRGVVVEWLKQQEKEQRLSRVRESDKKPMVNGLREEAADQARKDGDLSQIEGPTQRNKHGSKFSQKQKSTSVRHETQYMSTMSLEVHVNSRHELAPDPEHDEIGCIFWCLKADDDEMETNGDLPGTKVGVLALCENRDFARKITKETNVVVDEENTELDLLNKLVDIVRDFDPDVLTGYEVHNGSWGYLIERGRIKYEFDLCDELSRMKSQSHGRFGKESDRWGFDHTSTIRVTGRHTINIWRAMRSELNLLQYTMENVVFHVLHRRIPHYSFRDLSDWYQGQAPRNLAKCLEYYLARVQLDVEILDANELIPRTSEQARLIGVDFFSVFSRGSQFKVESFMFRIAKPENFLLVSPSRKQVGQQNALECLPLVMEPQSDFYSSPLVVLDFQSLYPSIMIAYNYCYSTCLGRIVGWRGQNKMGFADFQRQPGLLELVKDSINIAPNGMMYVKPEMRKSLLAKMLGEILETRVMVKSGMKVDKDDKTLQQLLNNRQLALKLLANVTYGYTSASFSGRMPCAEIADSIVQTGRETLEKAIALIHSVTRWGAEVVYGDTDSLFVYMKGRSREEAFSIGNEIAKAVTNLNPRPIKLKFEKVYHPCVLLAKKRYVGFKYESPSQTEPDFDAKGIETVRRDGTPAEQKIEEKALKLLFRTSDLSQVKHYFQRQCAKIMAGKVSVQDFCFAKEVKLGSYADKGPPPPGALISTRRMLADPRQEPQYGERVPYVVITGAPNARLIDRCVPPETLLKDDGAELDAAYYINKNLIPPLERIFNLVGANVRMWYDEMPKVQRVRDLTVDLASGGAEKTNMMGPLKKTLESYLKSGHCVICRTKLPKSKGRPRSADGTPAMLPLCYECKADASTSLYALRTRLREAEAKAKNLELVCRNCAALDWAEDVRCDSKDCPVFYSRVRARAKETSGRRLLETVAEGLEKENEPEALDW